VSVGSVSQLARRLGFPTRHDRALKRYDEIERLVGEAGQAGAARPWETKDSVAVFCPAGSRSNPTKNVRLMVIIPTTTSVVRPLCPDVPVSKFNMSIAKNHVCASTMSPTWQKIF